MNTSKKSMTWKGYKESRLLEKRFFNAYKNGAAKIVTHILRNSSLDKFSIYHSK